VLSCGNIVVILDGTVSDKEKLEKVHDKAKICVGADKTYEGRLAELEM